jgi:plastocyanin
MNALRSLTLIAVAALLAVPFVSAPAAAKVVNANLIQAAFDFHLDSPTGAADPTITAVVGDVIRFRVENQDSTLHTFTAPHFSVDRTLASAGAVIFVNITTTAADAGRWQFWCEPHSSGPDDEHHTGMIGYIQVNAATPPQTPGFDAFVAVLAVASAFAVVAVRRTRRN